TLNIGGLHLEVVALSDKREVEAQAGAHGPAPPIAGMAGFRQAVTYRAVIVRIDLVCGSHDLGTTPRLVEPDVADNIGRLKAAVARADGTRPHEKRGIIGIAPADDHRQRDDPGLRVYCAANGTKNLRHPALFSRDACRKAVAELGRVSPHPPASITGI